MKDPTMSHDIQHLSDEIEFLIAKKNIAKQNKLSDNGYTTLLFQLKKQYDYLTVLYMNESENYLMCQSLLKSADILREICEICPHKIQSRELYTIISRLSYAINDCYDFDLCRNAFVIIAHLYHYLGEYFLAERYVQKAFDDYDYSISTFRLYICILDQQQKFVEILSLMKHYLNMRPGFHEQCSIKDFCVTNILHSPYASAYKSLFEVRSTLS